MARRLEGRGGPGEPAPRLARAQRTCGSTPAERGFLRPGPPAVQAPRRRAGVQGPARNHRPGEAGRRAPVGGTTSEPPGSGGRRPYFEVGGRGGAWPGPAPLISASSPLSGLHGPAAWPASELRLGGFLCTSLPCNLHSPRTLQPLDFRVPDSRAPGVRGKKLLFKRLHRPARMRWETRVESPFYGDFSLPRGPSDESLAL